MFLFADEFFALFRSVRVCWFKGVMGSGKTLGAFAVAEELYRRRMATGIVSNVPWDAERVPIQPWRDLLPPGHRYEGQPRMMNGAAIVFDETWIEADSRTSMTNNRSYGALARKFECWWLCPSIFKPDKRLAYMSIARISRLSLPVIRQVFGLVCAVPPVKRALGPLAALSEEVWIYEVTLELEEKRQSTKFWLVNPSKYFGLYDTDYAPMDDGDISSLWERTLIERKQGDVERGGWYVPSSEIAGSGDGSSTGLVRDTAQVRSIALALAGNSNGAHYPRE